METITHDISVIDTAIYYTKNYQISNLITERELKHVDGYGNPKHQPDFIFTSLNKNYSVEVELTEKQVTTREKNVQQNFLKYDYQIWIVPNNKLRIIEHLQKLSKQYPISVISLEEVEQYVKTL